MKDGDEGDEFKDAVEGPEEEKLEEVTSKLAAATFNEVYDIATAREEKEKGNCHYKEGHLDLAIERYTAAINKCPPDDCYKEELATFYGNRSACYFSLQDDEMALRDCTVALENNTKFTKIYFRRSQIYERQDKLEEAIRDLQKVLELDPSYPKAAVALYDHVVRFRVTCLRRTLERKQEEKMNKLKDEALGKLKELGNSILGNFGMSLDNFKMQQDPATGSWNISMNK